MLVIRIDTGGTFTDFIRQGCDKSGELKRLFAPYNPAVKILARLKHLTAEPPFSWCTAQP